MANFFIQISSKWIRVRFPRGSVPHIFVLELLVRLFIRTCHDFILVMFVLGDCVTRRALNVCLLDRTGLFLVVAWFWFVGGLIGSVVIGGPWVHPSLRHQVFGLQNIRPDGKFTNYGSSETTLIRF